MRLTGSVLAFAALVAGLCAAGEVEVCPGEGPRYGDFKCNHDGTHRGCARLMDESSQVPLVWGASDFWTITGQTRWRWDDKIVGGPNVGDSWCICMWAFARMIETVGCENVHIRCEATDVRFVLDSYHDGGYELSNAHACLAQLCPSHVGLVSREL